MYKRKLSKGNKEYKPKASNPMTLIYDKDNNLVHYDLYKILHPAKYWLIQNLSRFNILRLFGIAIPLRWGKSHFKYIELMLNDLSNEVKKHVGPNETYLVLTHYLRPRVRARFRNYFENNNIKVIDLNDLGFGDNHLHAVGKHNFFISGDGYPKRTYHDILGKLLAKELDSL